MSYFTEPSASTAWNSSAAAMNRCLAASRSWQAVVWVHLLLGIHRFLTIYPDLVCQHSRGDVLVRGQAGGSLGCHQPGSDFGPLRSSLLWNDVAQGSPKPDCFGRLGMCLVVDALGGFDLARPAIGESRTRYCATALLHRFGISLGCNCVARDDCFAVSTPGRSVPS